MPQSSPAASGSTEDEPSGNADRPRPPLPRVAVPTFPQRNRPQGQVKRNADAEPPSPRHRMTKRVRHSYTAKEKLHWLKMQEFQPDLSNRALAKLAKVQPCQIRDWKKMRERLEVASGCRRRLMGAGRKAKYPFMERAVYRQFLSHRAKGLSVSVNMLQKWSAKYMKHRMPGVNWRASFRWSARFRARWHLARRVKTKMGQKLAAGNLQKPPAETVLRWIDESWEAVPEELVKKAIVTCGISTSINGTEDHLILAHMRDKGEVEVLDDVNEMVDDETVVNPFYAEVPMPAEELQVEEEDDAAEAEAEAEDEEGVGPADGEEAGECSDDDDWWRQGRFDGEEVEEWHAGDDDE
ncbi:unnamed protein product [Closterium sp. Naga37s-1]|nr:unnamed protein product [Closterium sp. Naga37s-1]